MSSVQQSSDSAGLLDSGAIQTVRNSVLLLFAVVGVIEVVLGYLINTGAWAAILAVWGTGLIVIGLVGHTFVWWKRQ